MFRLNFIRNFSSTRTFYLQNLGFVGGGNMNKAIIGGLINQGMPPKSIYVSEPNPTNASVLSTQYPDIQLVKTNSELLKFRLDSLILGVKPDVITKVLEEPDFQTKLKETSEGRQNRLVLLSIAAGVKVDTIQKSISGVDNLDVVRVMPNTPALVGCGAIGLYSKPNLHPNSRRIAELILHPITSSECDSLIWVEEERLMDVVTAISGSGPAYYFLMMQLMVQEAEKLGLDKQHILKLVTATALGAAKMVQAQCLNVDDNVDLEELRRRVTSPNGTTHAAIQQFVKDDGLQKLVHKAIQAGYHRSIELGNSFEK